MQNKEIILPSFAKTNLLLKVENERADGYHDLITLFQTISLADELRFQTSSELELACDDPSIPTDDSNLIIKAAKNLRDKFGVSSGANIFLKKRIPSPGGLGGGSSNAAVTLLALAKLWEIDVQLSDLVSIASELGSDVPFFLFGGTALGTGRGTEVEPVTDFYSDKIIIVDPAVAVSTAKIFKEFKGVGLTKAASDTILSNCRFNAAQVGTLAFEFENDLENVAFGLFPQIQEAKLFLREMGAVSSLMSGSGACVFGIFDNEESRQAALKALGEKTNWRSFAVTAITRERYREALQEVLL